MTGILTVFFTGLLGVALFACGDGQGAPPATEAPQPLGIVDAIATVGPPVRAQLERAQQQGIITEQDVAYAVPYIGSIGNPFLVGTVVETEQDSITVRTFLRKEGDAYFAAGEERTLAVTGSTEVERGLGSAIELHDLEAGEIVVVASRDQQLADRITGMGINGP